MTSIERNKVSRGEMLYQVDKVIAHFKIPIVNCHAQLNDLYDGANKRKAVFLNPRLKIYAD